ncbi:MAG TPA: maltotransferase domain-containing protein, partial [Actinomycetota bacterium]|nr:maltotransferase domain-containing protein [Actinomycetota bacterium]
MIERVTPSVDGGRFPAKATVGETVPIEADVFTDGHDHVAARVLHRRGADGGWSDLEMRALGNDRWRAELPIDETGTHRFRVEGWIDPWGT